MKLHEIPNGSVKRTSQWLPIAYIFLAIVISWTVWIWVRYPAPKTPSDKQVIAALLNRFEKEKQKSFQDGYDWCGAEPNPDLSGLKFDWLNNGELSGRPVAQ